MNITVHGLVFHVDTEGQLLLLLSSLSTLHALARRKAA